MSYRFITDDYLLNGDISRSLYKSFASRMPIIDYHCHISPRDIAENVKYNNITQIWLYGDHYKWRAMRACGIKEKYITGDADDREKFLAYCRAMPGLVGNPLYQWSHMELSRYFGCDLLLCPDNADRIWDLTKKRLQSDSMSAKSLIKDSGVEALCTTDDPCDDLEYHKAIACDNSFGVKVFPAFRPDKALNCDRCGYDGYINRLSDVSGIKIKDTASLKTALEGRIEYFVSLGMKTSDHGIDDYLLYKDADEGECDSILSEALNGGKVTFEQAAAFRCHMLVFLGSVYKKHGIVMQLHIGVLRNPNTVMFDRLGADSGYDTVHGRRCISDLARLLDKMSLCCALPDTVLYSADRGDDVALDLLCCAFNCDTSRIRHGSAWWFNDTYDGIRKQIKSLAGASALGSFIGMTTDSRSLLSYARHEYFRRIFCSVTEDLVKTGQCPPDGELLGQLVCDVCYNNVKSFFGF